jgi:hypothetical protein
MTCREASRRLAREGSGADSSVQDEALALHLAACHRCSQALKTARLSAALLEALREEIEPGPSFYPQLRERLRAAASGIGQPEAMLLQSWGFARRLVPALALGVLLLAGVTISLERPRSTLPVEAGREREIHAFSLEELNMPAAVGRPSQDQMLAFVLMESELRDAGRGR